jgi:NAD(P)-dependent dehydrogenase (short-subunit alcohol dehydrogenase family)
MREAHMRKTIVVTGTATGMGRATVDKLAAEGWNVVATVRRQSDVESHAGLPGVKTLLLDVDDEAAAAPSARLAQEQFVRVDVLVNNAGYPQMGPLEGASMDQVHRQYQTNVFSLLSLTKAFLPAFRAQRAGTVVNLASITSEQGYPCKSVYASSKAAVATLSESLSVELAEFGVVVRAILPGLHATCIFTKIDEGDCIPDAYRAGIALLRRQLPSRGRSRPHDRAVLLGSRRGVDPAWQADSRCRGLLAGVPQRGPRPSQRPVERPDLQAWDHPRRNGGLSTCPVPSSS